MDIEYDLKVKLSSNASKQEHTSDEDEPEDAYSNELLTDKNWLAQYNAERTKGVELEEQPRRLLSGAEVKSMN